MGWRMRMIVWAVFATFIALLMLYVRCLTWPNGCSVLQWL